MKELADFRGKLGALYYSLPIQGVSSKVVKVKIDKDDGFNKWGWFVRIVTLTLSYD